MHHSGVGGGVVQQCIGGTDVGTIKTIGNYLETMELKG